MRQKIKDKFDRNPWLRFTFKWLIVATTICAALVFVITFVPYHGNGMYPAIKDGDLLVVYRLAEYQNGDVICYLDEAGKKRVSRITATDGQTVLIDDSGEWKLNGFSQNEQVFYPTTPVEGSYITYPYTVSGYFLMDDYRTIGVDSRTFGSISKQKIVGKVVYVVRIRGI